MCLNTGRTCLGRLHEVYRVGFSVVVNNYTVHENRSTFVLNTFMGSGAVGLINMQFMKKQLL